MNLLTDDEDFDLSPANFVGLTKKQIQSKIYYEKNKTQINQKRAITINCECGGRYPLQQKSVHFKRRIHQNYLLNKKE